MTPTVYRCPSCNAPLQVGDHLVVTCAHCESEVYLRSEEQRRWQQQIDEVQERCAQGQALAEQLQPTIDAERLRFEAAVGEGRRVEVLLHFEALMRLEVAGPQVMVPDFDYEAEVVRPAVLNFAEVNGIELPPAE